MTLADLVAHFPSDPQGIKIYCLVLSTGYMALRKIVALLRRTSARLTVAQLGDTAAFTGSILAAMGVLNPPTLTAIGDTTLFLVIGCLGGLAYSVEELFAEGKKEKTARSASRARSNPSD